MAPNRAAIASMQMSRGWRTSHTSRTRRAAATGPGRSGFTLDMPRPLLVLELAQERDLIEQRLELVVGARLGRLAAEEGGHGGGEARVGAGLLDAREELGARELLAWTG